MPGSTGKKDKALFLKLVLAHTPGLKRFAMTLCKNDSDADDLVSDTVLKAYEKFNLLRDLEKAKPWLFSILNNQFLSNYRKRKRFVEMPSAEMLDSTVNETDFSLFESLSQSNFVVNGDPEKRFISKLTMKDINKAVNALPVEFRTALTLCDIEEFSYAEIAKTLKVPVGTVRSRIARARIILQKKLWMYARDLGIRKSRVSKSTKEEPCTCGQVVTNEKLKLAATAE